MLLRILHHIPLIQCLTHYSIEIHKKAAIKFIFLWLLTSSPIIVATILSPIPEGEANVTLKLFAKLKEAISVSELFVYSATFLSPIIYMIVERYYESPEDKFGKRSVKGIFKGYRIIFLFSTLLMFSTAIGFSNIKVDFNAFKISFLGYYLTHFVLIIYLFSLYCWYLTLLDGTSLSSGNFINENRASEMQISHGLTARLRAREAEDE